MAGYTEIRTVPPAIAVSESDTVTVVWQSAGQDGHLEGVFGQRFRIPDPGVPLPSLVATELPDAATTGACRGVSWVRNERSPAYSLYLVRRNRENVLLEADGSGGYIAASTPSIAHPGDGMATLAFDLDDNGLLDLYLLNINQPNVFYYQVNAGQFATATPPELIDVTGSRTAEALDYDLDGDLDLFLTHVANLPDLLLEFSGSGWVDVTPTVLATPSVSMASATADFDNDGDPDIYVVRWNQPNALVRNDGGGLWTDVTTPLLADSGDGTSAAWGDYDGDGFLDLALTNKSSSLHVFQNDGNGGFTKTTPPAMQADRDSGNANWIDYDNDGRLDLYYSRGPGSDRLWWNSGSGFLDVSAPPLSTPGNHAGAAWADMDDDGDLDLFQAEFEEDVPSQLLRNEVDNGNGWLEVDLLGATSNRFGVGSRLEVYTGSQKQIRDVLCSAGNKSQNAITAHFGLGQASVVDSLVVKWPSGIVQVNKGLAINQRIKIVEDAGSTGVDQPPTGKVEFALYPPAPNPFNPSTTIRFSLPQAGHASLKVYDLAGRLVRTLVDGERPAGEQQVVWDGKDKAGRSVASGAYLVRLEAGRASEVRRLVLLK